MEPELRKTIWAFQEAKGHPKDAKFDRVTREALGTGGDAVYASPPTYGRARERAVPALVDTQSP